MTILLSGLYIKQKEGERMDKRTSAKDFEEIYHKYKNTLYRIAFTYVKNQPDAEDILQEVFTARLYKAPVFQSEEHEKRWLIRVTVNYSKNYLKSFWHKNIGYMEDARTEIPWEEDSSKRELLEEVLSLPDKCKAAMYLHYYEGYTCKETGQILGCTESAVKMRLKKGRELLKNSLSDGGALYVTERL